MNDNAHNPIPEEFSIDISLFWVAQLLTNNQVMERR